MHHILNSVVLMVTSSLYDAFYFLVYYMMLLLMFCIQFMILGAVVIHLDYPNLNGVEGGQEIRYIYYFLQNFRNSLGDLQTPAYAFWEDYNSRYGTVVIYIIWGTWVANFIFTSLLMLNYLITVFGETHETILNTKNEITYKSRAKANVEVISIMKVFHTLEDIVFSVVTMTADKADEEEDEIKGVIANLTNVVNDSVKKIADNTDKRFDQLKQDNEKANID